MKKNFYVTTPIYYPSGNLHIGHAYTTTLADVICRYKKMDGYKTFFLTGSDEHGQKIELKAKENNLDPKTYVDNIVKNFKHLWNKLNINYDKFIRTTDNFHIETVQKIFSTLLKKDLIYLSKYKGEYCISCEEFLTKEQILDNKFHVVCKNEFIIFEQDSYMLRVSKFKEFLTNLFSTNFLEPENRKKEMLNNFINNELEDLSVTRVNFSWGIPVIEDPKHVIYVWIDALSNYISALGYLNNEPQVMNDFWSEETEVLQIIGKEITRFHSIYWPVILKSLDLRLPDKILSHGWILSKNDKMSKSLNNVIDPVDVINKYSSDSLRFYISYNLPTYKDGSFTDELFIESYNNNLANNVGNLISRTSNMIIKYFDGMLPNVDIKDEPIYLIGDQTIKSYKCSMDKYNISESIDSVLKLGQECNKYIEEIRPWDLDKNNQMDKLAKVLNVLHRNIVIIIYLLSPILVESCNKMLKQVGVDENEINFETLLNSSYKINKLTDREILFKRI
ncbi:methionine--tRNA ligase [Spiroplasma turonicum]|uniref:Methionine--tRNA ligase n=1 Tax=Spiroplasma turonicum TaxID=216946 RepID=A0A0K1P7P7_9MOLU|nr:methionine--tRNA ligase [Spiroplasma turonicum]AKU80310.1 methionyl-tRNA synthetase [Spiroplasma turonicum]ALX71311.1 methionyl-tRNA synthetase [Spiroplasma turonicum]